jgi:WD40 repeat protein
MYFKFYVLAVTIVKLSPNGSRVATASNKGTVIRIFSCAHGEKLEELRVGYELTKIMDIQFFVDGNLISCLT